MGEAGVFQYIWLKPILTCSMLTGGLLADPAGSPAAVVNFMAASYLGARVTLENYADELSEE
eukprot:5526321-Pyramimonas_sp.AAC.1